VVAADAGAMQFECGRATVLRAERAALQSRKGSADRRESYGSARWARTGSMARQEEASCSAITRRATDHAEARRVSALWRVSSCDSRDHEGRRTKLDLIGSKPLEDYHLPTTLGAEPKIACTIGSRSLLLDLWFAWC
jgi:hypothetical protein